MIDDKPHASIFAEASQWLVDLRVGDVDTEGSRRFNAWLHRSPEHIQAYMESAALWADIPTLSAGMEVDVDAVIAHARAQNKVIALKASGSNVHETSAARAASPSIESARQCPRRMLRWAAAAAAIVLATFVTWAQFGRGPEYATAIGEQRTIMLADRSSMELGARSRVRVRFSADERHIELIDGQVLFSVAKDASRPFVVISEDARVRVIGTQFDVHRRSSGTTVTVLEGRVDVEGGSQLYPGGTHALYVNAGEQVTVPAAGKTAGQGDTARLRTVKTAVTRVPVERTLIFEDAPLSDVVEEFNRYNEKQIVVTDTALQSLRISGVFSADKPASLLRFLEEQMHLNLQVTARQIQLSSAPAKKR